MLEKRLDNANYYFDSDALAASHLQTDPIKKVPKLVPGPILAKMLWNLLTWILDLHLYKQHRALEEQHHISCARRTWLWEHIHAFRKLKRGHFLQREAQVSLPSSLVTNSNQLVIHPGVYFSETFWKSRWKKQSRTWTWYRIGSCPKPARSWCLSSSPRSICCLPTEA